LIEILYFVMSSLPANFKYSSGGLKQGGDLDILEVLDRLRELEKAHDRAQRQRQRRWRETDCGEHGIFDWDSDDEEF
jgi:hypothetical protein